jgi:hypothetical protein
MTRIVLENIAIFLIPTLLYAVFVFVTAPHTRDSGERAFARLLNDAPLLWLFTAGAILVFVCLIAFQSTDGGRPGMIYQGPIMQEGGRISPGHAEPPTP